MATSRAVACTLSNSLLIRILLIYIFIKGCSVESFVFGKGAWEESSITRLWVHLRFLATTATTAITTTAITATIITLVSIGTLPFLNIFYIEKALLALFGNDGHRANCHDGDCCDNNFSKHKRILLSVNFI